jgi:Na+-translocating ferredoxin:NAD+ oxidoreductase RnfE subunit
MKKQSAFLSAFRHEHLILSLGLGLFIFLAGAGSLTRAMMMTVALAANLFLSTLVMYGIKKWLTQETKFIVTLIVMATIATIVQLLSVTFLPGWVRGIEIYLPLIAVSGMMLARIETVVQTGQLKDVLFDTLGSILSFAFLVVPLGILADLFGLGVFQLASFQIGEPQPYWFSFTLLPENLRLPIFTGTYGAIGLLILAALWLALVQRFRRKQA